jgi:required for meiotic nuclear division protein 1
MEEETIVLNCETVSIKDKLAFSNGLADSVKLGILEGMLDEHIDKVKAIPSALMRNSKIALGRGEMLSLTGELLHFRAQLNLNSDLLDTPDIYWSEPKLEDLYIRISRVLETRRRTAILNKKLDYAKEMAQVLSEHLAEKHGLKLEWGIIALIAVEVAFETFHLIEKFI